MSHVHSSHVLAAIHSYIITAVRGEPLTSRERISGVDSVQATMMGKMRPFGPHWRLNLHISVVLILGPSSIDPEIACLTMFWSLRSAVDTTGRPNLNMLRTANAECAKSFPAKTDCKPLAQKFKCITHDQIEAALQFATPKLAWLNHFLWNTLTATDNGEMVILWVYWPLTQWLIKQVSTPSQSHFLPLIPTLTFNSATHQL